MQMVGAFNLIAAATALAAAIPVGADERPLRDVIDAEVRAAWQRRRSTPAGRADDAAFLRRVYLDLVGTIPTDEEARAVPRRHADAEASARS